MTDPIAPPPDAPGGYRIRPDAVWAEARDAYLWGFTAEEVCERYDLGLSAFKARAAREKWRRADQPHDLPDDPGLTSEDDLVASSEDLAAIAWGNAARALRASRSVEAQRWLRIHADLTRPARTVSPPPPPQSRDPMIDFARHYEAITRVVRTLKKDPDVLWPAGHPDTPLGRKVHDVDPLFPSPQTAAPAATDPPLNRADRRRQAREARGRAPP